MMQRRFERPPRRKRLLPDKYLEQGYFKTNNVLFDQLLIEEPRIIVKALTDNARDLEDKPIEYGQFRKFFDYVRQIERKIKWGETWDEARQELLQLVSYANNSFVRQLAPNVFLKFVEINVKEATNAKSSDKFLKGMLIHWECITGFWPRERKT